MAKVFLAYTLAPLMEKKSFTPEKMRSGDEIDLAVYNVVGDIIFKVSDADFSIRDQGKNVLAVASQFWNVKEWLKDHNYSAIQFVASEQLIHFNKNGLEVEVSSTYTDETATVALDELTEIIEKFVADMYDSLTRYFPQIVENTTLSQWFPTPGENGIKYRNPHGIFWAEL